MFKLLLISLTLLNSALGDLSGDVDTVELPHKDGPVYIAPKDITPGCARFYISDPIKFKDHGTKWWQMCAKPGSDTSNKYNIGSGIFVKIKDKYGAETANSISYISTGPDTWVNIYAQPRFEGHGYEITPLRDVDLAIVDSGDNPDEETFNDNVLSGYIRSYDSSNENPDSNIIEDGIIPVAVWYKFENAPRQPTDSGCGYFYDADPNGADVNGIVLCVSNNQHLAHVSVKDLKNRGLILKKSKEQSKLQALNHRSGPWKGDREPAYHTHIKNSSNRKLSSSTGIWSFITDDFWTSLGGFWEGFVESISTVFEEAIQIFTGPPPVNVTNIDNSTFILPNITNVTIDSVPEVTASAAPAAHINTVDLTGIKYVEAGPDLDIGIWTEDEFKGDQEIIKSGQAVLLDNRPVNSIFLISNHYKKTVPGGEPALLAKASKDARKEEAKK